MKIIDRLLSKNLSAAQMAGFVLSNFIGLAIVTAGLQFYCDMRSIWDSEDSFIKKDYLVINKKVTASNTLGQANSDFTDAEIADLQRQPWVRKVGEFSGLQYRVAASVQNGGRGMSTEMFFESIPGEFIDVDPSEWHFAPGDAEVPIIISKDYLTLYNFGFSTSAGLPQLSEQMMSAIPMTLRLRPERREVNDGQDVMMAGRVVGFSNRLNTILVPQEFMDWSNALYGKGEGVRTLPRRLIVDVSSPGDVAITDYLKAHNLETAGDKSASQASYLLNVVSGVIVGVGVVITVLSFFILLLSISLLMQKNREKLHALIMLGYDLGQVAAPYCRLTVLVSVGAWLLAVGAMFLFRSFYIGRIAGLTGGEEAGVIWSLSAAAILALLTILFNILSIRRKVRSAFLN